MRAHPLADMIARSVVAGSFGAIAARDLGGYSWFFWGLAASIAAWYLLNRRPS